MDSNNFLRLVKVLREALEVNDLTTVKGIFDYIKILGIKEYQKQCECKNEGDCKCQSKSAEIEKL